MPGADGGSGLTAALKDKNTTRLLHVCGEHVELPLHSALLYVNCSDEKYRLLHTQANNRRCNIVNVWYRPLFRELQDRFPDCRRCSPFGSLMVRNTIRSGSMPEGLSGPNLAPSFQGDSDLDLMIEVGPLRWKFPEAQESCPLSESATGSAAAFAADGSDPAPRLMIADTENPGFVLVLQERKNSCPHQECQPFKAEAVMQLMRDFQTLSMITADITQQSTNGPANSFSTLTNEAFKVTDFDEVPCLHVPVWWFSDEFFTRRRRHNWPPETVRENIRRFGLHLVPVGAPGSATEKIEFRLSFSRAEVVVIWHVYDIPLLAAIAFKMCKSALGEEGKAIKSYYVKTALLWLCEEMPADNWKSIIQGVLMLLDYLDEAVKTGNLPCFFWSRINLLRFASRTDRKAMRRTLVTIRRHLQRLLAHQVSAMLPSLARMLTIENRRMSERHLRVCLARWLISTSVSGSMTRYAAMEASSGHFDGLPPALIRSYTPGEVSSVFRFWKHWYFVQLGLFQALTVVPEDIASRVRFSATDGGGFTWDAAPLMELLTDDVLEEVLGNPDTVRTWLRQQHQLSEARWTAGLPADMRSSRDRCELLLNIPRLIRVIKNSAPSKWDTHHQLKAMEQLIPGEFGGFTIDGERQAALKCSAWWVLFADDLCEELGMDQSVVFRATDEIRQLCDDPETLAECRRTWCSLEDPWQLRCFTSGSCLWGMSRAARVIRELP